MRSLLFALPLVLASLVTGCAASSDSDDAAQTEGAATAASPITIANYVSHPKIKAIRDQVGAIEHLALTKAANPGCDGGNVKYTDAQGRIRKFVEEGGEGGFAGRTTVYYSEQGKAIFAFAQEADYTNEKSEKILASESRVYFDAATGKTIFEAVRTQELSNELADWTFDNAITGTDRLPTAEEAIPTSEAFADPVKWFATTGCAKPEQSSLKP